MTTSAGFPGLYYRTDYTTAVVMNFHMVQAHKAADGGAACLEMLILPLRR
jgi:hypothetical protein